MSIEIVCSSRELFGADRAALRLAQTFQLLDREPFLVLPKARPERGLAAAADDAGIPWVERSVPLATSSGLDSVAGLRARHQRIGLDPTLSVINSASILAGSAPGARKVLMVREWLDPRSPKHRALVLRHRLGLDTAVAVSQGVMRQWRGCVRGPRHQVVVNDWLDDATIQAYSHGARERAGSIVCVGRFNQWKGQEVLADAFELAYRAHSPRPSMRFVGAQPGTEFAERAHLIAERGHAEGWSVEPFVADPSQCFQQAALLVLPSMRPEPFGLVLLEGLAAGCTIIAFEGGGPDDLASAFPGVVRTVRRDVSSLAEALAGWWDAGGHSQTSSQHHATLEMLHERFSPTGAQTSWRRILARVESGTDRAPS